RGRGSHNGRPGERIPWTATLRGGAACRLHGICRRDGVRRHVRVDGVHRRRADEGVRHSHGIRRTRRRDPATRYESESAYRVAWRAAGLLASIGLSRFLGALLFEIKATDPVVYSLLSIGLILVTLGAALIPAIRASRHNPVTLLSADR